MEAWVEVRPRFSLTVGAVSWKRTTYSSAFFARRATLVNFMDLTHMLAALRAERQQIEEPILVLQRLAATSSGKRRGRLPKWMASEEASIPTLPTRKRKPFSAATRKRMAAAQRKRRAAARKAGARIVGSVSLARSR